MQESRSPRHRFPEESQGGVPSWLIEENGQHDVVARTPSRTRQAEGSGRSTYPGLCGSPDTRRTFYRSTRQQHRDERRQKQYQHSTYQDHQYHQTQPQVRPPQPRRKPQHQLIGNMQRMPASEPIYMDIDPSIHERTKKGEPNQLENAPSSPSDRLRTLGRTSTALDTDQGRYASAPSNSLQSPFRQAYEYNVHSSPSPATRSRRNQTEGDERRAKDPKPDIPFVNPYVSQIAREYQVPGGMFPTQSTTKKSVRASPPPPRTKNQASYRYDDRPVHDRELHHERGDGLIMFGDDYDLGSINTGTSQQELLQKRRDVKKRREGKYGKKKKSKERIINMPPRLLAWDNSPITTSITKLTSKDNSHHTPYKDSIDGKKHSQWSILRAFTPPDEGSTDASTRESGEEGAQRPAVGVVAQAQRDQSQCAPGQCDNVSVNSFPLLSTNAKEGLLTEKEREHPVEAQVHYAQPGNIPQLQVTMPRLQDSSGVILSPNSPQIRQHVLPPSAPPQQKAPAAQPLSRGRIRPQHADIYQRQHGEELLQLESHLRYLEQQQQQLENRVQERQHFDKASVAKDERNDDRPRSVHFAARIARDIEEKEEKNGDTQDSPTSVAQFDIHLQENSNSSDLSPKTLFPGKPKSILRMKGAVPLDSTGRYPKTATNRGRGHVPVFTDSSGREVSPIRSPGRYQRQQTSYQMAATPTEETSIPDNPDDKDTAVLFDSDPDVDLELMRKEFDEDSGLVSDAFIEAVAAIVLQTAIRRFLAIRKVQWIRAHRRLLEESRGQSTPDSSSHEQTAPPMSMRYDTRQNSTGQQHEKSIDASKQLKISDESMRAINAQHPIHEFYDLAAIQIQCVFRGWWVRDSINVDHYCTTLIQKVFRGFRARVEFNYDLYRIIVTQAVWRRALARRRTQRVLSLVIRSQALYRGVVARKTLSSLAAPSSPSRREWHVGKAQVLEKNQNLVYTRSSHEQARPRKMQRDEPALRPRQPSSMEEARIWHVGAIIIQTYWRSYVGRICYVQSLCDVIIAQSVARRWLIRRWMVIDEGNKASVRRQHSIAISASDGRFTKLTTEQSLRSSNKKHGSIDDSVPSVPLLMLPEDEPERPLKESPPMPQAREQQMQSQHGHFNDPSRFGGARTVWKKGTMPNAQRGEPHSPSSGPRSSGNVAWNPQTQNQGKSSQYSGIMSGANTSNRKNLQVPTSRQAATGSPRPIPIQQGAKDPPRAKGWNAEEDINKESTRSLLMAWKQKDKANTFTIRRPGT